ncbi:carboxypeptidase-like regulatory domain-containing protein [Pararhizobium sp. IMCC21322]|uniref:carboxypeptidase-like regulatory domain-containing protein n=1 Tax=Pararhizobium sp. IMCC21322 TaxID=3067903 RepID=UPI0027413FAB|nr:carboxypeptidase-like regulatory domain-containing protein [Pararhizobium sp. IMCC21322]
MVRRWLFNRFSITFGMLAVLIAFWNIYVEANNTGLIAGRVIGPDGAPVTGAIVSLSERTLLVTRPKGTAETDEDGQFKFENQDVYRLYLAAEKPGVGETSSREYRLYFKGQELVLKEPLKLVAEQ